MAFDPEGTDVTDVPTVALAVSGHGFGHAVRSAEVARELVARGARVVVRTDAPRWLFPPGATFVENPAWPLDIGVAQHDSLELDVDATRRQWETFARDFEAHAAAEANLLQEHAVDFLLGDIPPLAFAAAHRAGIPSLGVTNFTWDWIYSAWPDFQPVVARIQAAYALANGLLRLPLHSTSPEAFNAWRSIADVPLIARRARRDRGDVRNELGLSQHARVVLISFGGFGARGLQLSELGRWRRYTFLLTPPLAEAPTGMPENVIVLNETPADYVSLFAACDAVVTKPGYGILADALANRVAVLFTDRGPFREYEVLAEALPRLGRARYVPRDDLLRGFLGPHLDALFATTSAWTEQCMDGAARVAEHVLRKLTIKQQSA